MLSRNCVRTLCSLEIGGKMRRWKFGFFVFHKIKFFNWCVNLIVQEFDGPVKQYERKKKKGMGVGEIN